MSFRSIKFGLSAVAILFICCGFSFAVQDNTDDDTSAKPPTEDAADDQSTAAEKPTSNNKEDQEPEDDLAEILQGHSYHGDAFNEGPRQKAYLMGGTGNVNFEVTTTSEEAQAFINQGIGQLHGFWDLEAERSFRHAASLDEKCAMAYWGAARATIRNEKRARGFIKKAVELKDNASKREQMYIDALNKYLQEKPDKKKRAETLLKDLESIILEYPTDLEAKAFVALRIWLNAREGIPVASHIATNALLDDIFEVEPLHPAHHFAIHLWDYRKPEMALDSAARGGPAAPSIAHMWHMPGHIYSRLKRYEDAVYQQEASARVDHAHMMRDRVMPDEIHNFAHNNEWLIRNLVFIGRVEDAISLAKNMTELPQHPKYNTLEKRNGSASYGRRRLLQVLREYEIWDQAFTLCQSPILSVPDDEEEQLKTLRLLGSAAAMLAREPVGTLAGQADVDGQAVSPDQNGAPDDGTFTSANESTADPNTHPPYRATLLRTLEELAEIEEIHSHALRRLEARNKLLEKTIASNQPADRPPIPRLTEKPEEIRKEIAENKKEISKSKRIAGNAEKAILAIEGYQLVAERKYGEAHEKLKKATGEDVSWLGELEFLAGKQKEGLETVKKQVDRRPKEVIPMARLAHLQNLAGMADEAKATFGDLREMSSSMDLHVPIFARLRSFAEELGFGEHWLKPLANKADTGFRPPLDALGPFNWSPSVAPKWSLADSENKTISSDDFRGKPHIVIFYLGHGCLHCAEQLNAFGPELPKFQAAGIEFVAISTDQKDQLSKSIADYKGIMPFKNLVSDDGLEVFKKYRAHDDFEGQPLHGTFLVDGDGKIRWQDIGYEPFMDHKFLLGEAERLLKQGESKHPLVNRKP